MAILENKYKNFMLLHLLKHKKCLLESRKYSTHKSLCIYLLCKSLYTGSFILFIFLIRKYVSVQINVFESEFV